MDLLQQQQFTCSVSSVLNKNVKQHGKHYMYDLEEDTAWSSDEGKPQVINITFNSEQSLSAFSMQFQGGFAGKDGIIIMEDAAGQMLSEENFWPEDINAVQQFVLKTPITLAKVKKIKFIFKDSYDFFGRLIIYKLKILS